jgi:hypothetical protein
MPVKESERWLSLESKNEVAYEMNEIAQVEHKELLLKSADLFA